MKKAHDYCNFVCGNLKQSSNFVNRWRCDSSKYEMLKLMCKTAKCTLHSIKLLKCENICILKIFKLT